MARAQMRHPLTDKRISITASTPAHVELLKRQIVELGEDVRNGRRSLEDALERIEEKRSGRIANARRTVLDVYDAWAAAQDVDGTKIKAASVRVVLARHFDGEAAIELTDKRLEDWAATMKREGYQPGSVGSYFDLLKAAFRRAERRGELHGLPWRQFRPPRGGKGARPAAATSVAELAAIVRAALDVDTDRRARGLYSDLAARVLVVALLGLRNGEAAGLGWDHVRWEAALEAFMLSRIEPRGRVTIAVQALDGWRQRFPEKPRPDFPVKGRRAHTQELHPDAARALAAQVTYLRTLGLYRDAGPVFPSPRSGSWRPNAQAIDPAEVRELAKRAGLSGRWVTHSLRHSFVTLELGGGGSSRSTQQRSRHASLAQMERYAHDAAVAPPSAIGRLDESLLLELLPHIPTPKDEDEDGGTTKH